MAAALCAVAVASVGSAGFTPTSEPNMNGEFVASRTPNADPSRFPKHCEFASRMASDESVVEVECGRGWVGGCGRAPQNVLLGVIMDSCIWRVRALAFA